MGLLHLFFGLGGVMLIGAWLALLVLAVVRVAGVGAGELCCQLLGLNLHWGTLLALEIVLPGLLVAGWIARRRRDRRVPGQDSRT